MQSVPITTKVVSSNLAYDVAYSTQHYVINLSVTCAGRWFSLGTQVSSTNKTDRHDVTVILLKVAMNTNHIFCQMHRSMCIFTFTKCPCLNH